MYKQIDFKLNDKVKGYKDTSDQIEINYERLEKEKYFSNIEMFFYPGNIDNILQNTHIMDNIIFPKVEGRLFKKCDFTDLMRFSPYMNGFKYIVSEQFVKVLKENKINDYVIKEIKLKGAKKKYFLFFVPKVLFNEINFKKSLIYRGNSFGGKPIEYLKIKNYQDFLNLQEKFTFLTFEKICLRNKHKNKDIIWVQGSVYLFFKINLIEKIINEKITNFNLVEEKSQQKLIFD